MASPPPSTAAVTDALAALRPGLTTIAVTGTNGKTSTTSMLAAIVAAAGQTPVRVTTLGMWVADEQVADDGSMASFVRTLDRARRAGAQTLCLEVTSRALASGFAERWPADIAVFTNLSLDHLDRHGSAEAYLAAKARLFVGPNGPRAAVLNGCDPASKLLSEVIAPGTMVRAFGRRDLEAPPVMPLDLWTSSVTATDEGTCLSLGVAPGAACLQGELLLGVAGDFQADNALAAALAADQAGLSSAAIRDGLAGFAGVPGRFERVAEAPLAIVDFAHSPDALLRTLGAARALSRDRVGELICVFGCGGERDETKRGAMGEIADRLCDQVWLTTDNPRTEAPERIAAMVKAGSSDRAVWHQEPDRRRAVHAALTYARTQDVVVVAGRGHERMQWLATGPAPSHDADLVREAVARRG